MEMCVKLCFYGSHHNERCNHYWTSSAITIADFSQHVN